MSSFVFKWRNRVFALVIFLSMSIFLANSSCHPTTEKRSSPCSVTIAGSPYALTCGFAIVYVQGPPDSFKGGYVTIANVSSIIKSPGVAYYFGIGFSPVEWITAGLIDRGSGPKLYIDHYINFPQTYELWETNISLTDKIMICPHKLETYLWNIRLIRNGILMERNITTKGLAVQMFIAAETCSLTDVINADFIAPTSNTVDGFLHWWIGVPEPYQLGIDCDYPYTVVFVPFETYHVQNIAVIKNERGGRTRDGFCLCE